MTQCTFLKDRIADFEAARAQYEELASGLDESSANRQPRPGKWSVAENLAHLSLVAAGYFPNLEKAITAGRSRGRTGAAPFTKKSLVGGLLLNMLDPAKNTKLKAPGAFKASVPSIDWGQAKDRFESDLDHFIALARDADGLDLDRCRLPTPLAPWPKMTAAEAFRLHALHIPRHLDQAERAVKATAGA
ncbi:MAG: DinB family protein [Acidobacteriota bacterium]